jgi:hypothetical protein
MPNDQHQFIEQMIKAVKNGQDVSVWQKHAETSDLANTILKLSAVPRRSVRLPDLAKMQARILDRIEQKQTAPVGVWASIPSFLKIGSAVFGSLMIVISLTMGLAVAALQSVPGQAIYPLKKIVENIELRLTPESEVATLQVQFADNRVNEIQIVLEQQEQGQITAQEAQKIVSATIKDLQKTTSAAARSTTTQPKSTIASKLADISNKLRVASVKTEGEVKIELEKAVQSTNDSQVEAAKNAQLAGLEVEGEPVIIPSTVTANGKLTAAAETAVSIGNIKFLITKDTKLTGLTLKDLKIGISVDIVGQIKDNKTYADEIKLIIVPTAPVTDPTETETEEPKTTPTETPSTGTETETQSVQ